jgi:hypothetical protein
MNKIISSSFVDFFGYIVFPGLCPEPLALFVLTAEDVSYVKYLNLNLDLNFDLRYFLLRRRWELC